MMFNLNLERQAVAHMKAELGIPKDSAYCIELSMWQYKSNRQPTLECKVSVFTDDGRCIQGYGADFAIARQVIRTALKPKSCNLGPNDTLTVTVGD